MLRVRPDGKLGSPKAKEVLQDEKPRRGRSARLPSAVRRKLAIIRYGQDDERRVKLGGQIDDILVGEAYKAIPSNPEAPVRTNPPKPTHPFFLGGAALVQSHKNHPNCDDVAGSELEKDRPPPKPRETDTKKSRITSKPPGTLPPLTEDVSPGWKSYGQAHARMSRFSGAMEAVWPPQDMLHVGRGTELSTNCSTQSHVSRASNTGRKLKDVEIKIPAEDEVLQVCLDLVRACRTSTAVPQREMHRDQREFQRPLRRLMNGVDLQRAVHQRMESKGYGPSRGFEDDQSGDELSASNDTQTPIHEALKHVSTAIPSSSTAFDMFQCETQEWVHKYAPKRAEDVLQPGPEAILLRDWLKALTTDAVDDCKKTVREMSLNRKLAAHKTKRKRKRIDQLDDFLISSDEEANVMDELSDSGDILPSGHVSKKTVVRGGNNTGTPNKDGRPANAVVISGPHGCGKTAAVYAVAQELGFEIFEINPGSRRSGKDILDKVGDMTRNHLMGKPTSETSSTTQALDEDVGCVDDDLGKDIGSGKQGTMNNFFKPKGTADKPKAKSKPKAPKTSPKRKEASKRRKNQKQSLILLEEVDLLFEEDKLFWSTTLSLILQSRRPVIMTCNDESLLPMQELILYAILRFTPPPAQLAIDYLMLVACNEGHLIDRDTVRALYQAKANDLRASLSELNFFCQMAVGDTKGGLDWMLLRTDADNLGTRGSHPVRVVSEDTYNGAVGTVGGNLCRPTNTLSLDQEVESLSEVWNTYGLDVGGYPDYFWASATPSRKDASRKDLLGALMDVDAAAETLSAADTYPASIIRDPGMVLLDTEVPELLDKQRSNYTEGLDIVVADPLIDHTGFTEYLVLTLRVCARRIIHQCGYDDQSTAPKEQSLAFIISAFMQRQAQEKKPIDPSTFEPLSRFTGTMLGKIQQISTFDGPLSIMSVDLAPYVRNIVCYDVRLENQRRQLNVLLSRPGEESSKVRKTRSARAALEGGQKALTRREKWFPSDLDINLVLRSGGSDWQPTLQRFMLEADGELLGPSRIRSRRSSVGSTMDSDL